MKTCAVVLALLAASFAVAAEEENAALKVGDEAPEVQAAAWLNSDPLALEGLRGKIVVVEFWATWCPPCRTSIPHLVELYRKFSKQGVVIMGLTNEGKSTVDPFAINLGMVYPVGCGSMSGRPYGVKSIPRAFIVDPAGKIAWIGNPMSGLDKPIDAQLKKTPPTLMDPRTKAAMLILVDRIDEAVKQQKYAEAVAILSKLKNPDADPEVKARVQAVRKSLGASAETHLAAAEEHAKAGRFHEAAVSLQAVIDLAPGSDQAKQAGARLKALLADKKAGPVIEQGRRDHEADLAFADLAAIEKKDDPAALLKALDDFAAKYPKTRAGRAAADRAKAMRADPDLMKRLHADAAESDCKGWLSMARNFIKAGMPEKAEPYLKKVIETYPKTDYADEARKMLAQAAKEKKKKK